MQISRLLNILVILSLGFTVSCIEKFSPDIDDYEGQLVVDGVITNLDEPYQIKLSNTSPVDDPEYRPLEGAEVIVEDSEHNTYTFGEIAPGTYQNADFTGEVGVSYRLLITTPNGKQYETAYLEMPSSNPIDTVYPVIETRATEDPEYDEIGYQFYLSTHDPQGQQWRYLWKLTETYEYNADYSLDYTYSGGFTEYPSPLEFYTCWRTNKVEELFLFDATTIQTGNLENIPLVYVNTETRKLSVRYSLLIDQYVITEDAYVFFKAVNEMNSGDDLLYTTQPYQIQGNVECVSNPDEKVLGLFWVAGKTNQRIFVDPPIDISFYYEICTINTQGVPYIGNYNPLDWPIYLTTTDNGEMGIVGQACVDCRLRGGTLEMPDFWENH